MYQQYGLNSHTIAYKDKTMISFLVGQVNELDYYAIYQNKSYALYYQLHNANSDQKPTQVNIAEKSTTLHECAEGIKSLLVPPSERKENYHLLHIIPMHNVIESTWRSVNFILYMNHSNNTIKLSPLYTIDNSPEHSEKSIDVAMENLEKMKCDECFIMRSFTIGDTNKTYNVEWE